MFEEEKALADSIIGGDILNQSIKWIVILNKKYEKIWKIGSLFIKKELLYCKGRKYEWIQH